MNLEKKVGKDGKEKEIAPNYKKNLHDPHGRLGYGIPPRGYADLAFVQHMLASLKDNGRLGVVLPHGVLFRGGEEGKIRTGLLAGNSKLPGDRIEAVIGLPSALFYNTGIPACILVINKQKPAALKNKVIFIDASRECHEGKNQNSLRPQDIDHIHGAYTAAVEQQTDEDKYCRVVDMDEIAANDYENGDGLPLIQGNADIKNRFSAPRIYTSEITRECKPDDILMTVRAPVGYVAKSRHNGCIGRGICSIRPSKIESEYLYQYLIGYEQSWKKLEQGSTFTAVNSDDVKGLLIAVPPKTEQKKIASILSAVDNKLDLIDRKITTNRTLKKTVTGSPIPSSRIASFGGFRLGGT